VRPPALHAIPDVTILTRVKSKPEASPKTRRDRREAILAAAAAVFARKGYGSTRIEDVAREAGLSYGLAYYYFSSKDRLFHLVTQRALDSTMACYRAAQELRGPSYAKLRYLAEQLLPARFSREGMPQTLIMVHAFTHTGIPRATRKLVASRLQESEEVLMQMIRGAQAEGYAAGKDPRSLAAMLSALLVGCAVMRMADASAPAPDVDTFLSFLA
jgi:AcrR family transcriptional regulator